MRNQYLANGLIAGALMCTGCMVPTAPEPPSRANPATDVTASAGQTEAMNIDERSESLSRAVVDDWVIDSGWLQGDMGNVHGFLGAAYQTEVSLDSWGALSVTLHTGREGGASYGWAMARLDFVAFEIADDTQGDTRRLIRGVSDSPSSVLGCSGPGHGDWDFDVTAENVTVRVDAGPQAGESIVTFEARFYNGNVIQGGFSVSHLNPPSTTDSGPDEFAPRPPSSEPSEPSEPSALPSESLSSAILDGYEVERGWLEGGLGAMRGFSGMAYQTEASLHRSGVLYVTLHTGSRGGAEHAWAMSSLEFLPFGRVTLGDETPREPIVGVSRDPAGLLGCAGTSHGNWNTFDGPADDVSVQVVAGDVPGMSVVTFQASFFDGSTVRGGFTLRATSTESD